MMIKIFAGLSMLAVVSAQAVELPVVPVSVMKNTDTTEQVKTDPFPVRTGPVSEAGETPPVVKAQPAPRRTPARLFMPSAAPDGPMSAAVPAQPDMPAPPLRVTNEKSEIVVLPGVTEIAPVALGQLNRIVTPFEHPEVKTTSTAMTSIDANVLYLAPRSEAPVGLYITEKGDETNAISITMIPKRIPPREIHLRLGRDTESPGFAARANAKARHWEESYPYEETLRNILRAVAKQELPQGYALNKGVAANRRPCFSEEASRAGVVYEFEQGQTLVGGNFDVVIGVASNDGSAAIELKETWCANSTDIAAVAYWPEVVLEPHESTEVYVVLRHGATVTHGSSRPSLLGGAP